MVPLAICGEDAQSEDHVALSGSRQVSTAYIDFLTYQDS